MKKVFALMLVGTAMSIVACGPSEEEKKKIEAEMQALADSLAKAANASMDAAAATVDTAAAATEAAPAEGTTTTEEKK